MENDCEFESRAALGDSVVLGSSGEREQANWTRGKGLGVNNETKRREKFKKTRRF